MESASAIAIRSLLLIRGPLPLPLPVPLRAEKDAGVGVGVGVEVGVWFGGDVPAKDAEVDEVDVELKVDAEVAKVDFDFEGFPSQDNGISQDGLQSTVGRHEKTLDANPDIYSLKTVIVGQTAVEIGVRKS